MTWTDSSGTMLTLPLITPPAWAGTLNVKRMIRLKMRRIFASVVFKSIGLSMPPWMNHTGKGFQKDKERAYLFVHLKFFISPLYPLPNRE